LKVIVIEAQQIRIDRIITLHQIQQFGIGMILPALFRKHQIALIVPIYFFCLRTVLIDTNRPCFDCYGLIA